MARNLDISRRGIMKALGLVGAYGIPLSRTAISKSLSPLPRMVFITLDGGYDSTLSTDPKDPAKVDGKIDIEYRKSEIIRGKKRLYGPFFAPLIEHEEDIALLHGVRVDTVAHGNAYSSLRSGKLNGTPSDTPIVKSIASALADNRAMTTIDIVAEQNPYLDYPGIVFTDAMYQAILKYPNWFGKPDDSLSRAVHLRQSEKILGRKNANQLLSSNFILDLKSIKNPFADVQMGPKLHSAMVALMGNYSSCISINLPTFWLDSHSNNLPIQRARLLPIFRDIKVFLSMLKSTRDSDNKTLWDQTTVVIGTEIGRYPRLNPNLGKDHWPETTWMFCGRGIRKLAGGLTLGETDDQLRSKLLNFTSGRIEKHGRPVFPEAVFATLIKLAGGSLHKSGYKESDVISALLS